MTEFFYIKSILETGKLVLKTGSKRVAENGVEVYYTKNHHVKHSWTHAF